MGLDHCGDLPLFWWCVCSECSDLEGNVYTIKEAHGMIPLHPNCRCAWKPHIELKGKR